MSRAQTPVVTPLPSSCRSFSCRKRKLHTEQTRAISGLYTGSFASRSTIILLVKALLGRYNRSWSVFRNWYLASTRYPSRSVIGTPDDTTQLAVTHQHEAKNSGFARASTCCKQKRIGECAISSRIGTIKCIVPKEFRWIVNSLVSLKRCVNHPNPTDSFRELPNFMTHLTIKREEPDFSM